MIYIYLYMTFIARGKICNRLLTWVSWQERKGEVNANKRETNKKGKESGGSQ